MGVAASHAAQDLAQHDRRLFRLKFPAGALQPLLEGAATAVLLDEV